MQGIVDKSFLHQPDNFINHKCKLTLDKEGNKLEKPIIVEYDWMTSEKINLLDFLSEEYIGKGECVSVYHVNSQRDIPISGSGHFFRNVIKK